MTLPIYRAIRSKLILLDSEMFYVYFALTHIVHVYFECLQIFRLNVFFMPLFHFH